MGRIRGGSAAFDRSPAILRGSQAAPGNGPTLPHPGGRGDLLPAHNSFSNLSPSLIPSRGRETPPWEPPQPGLVSPLPTGLSGGWRGSGPLTLSPFPVCPEELWGEPGELQRGAAEAGAAPAGEGGPPGAALGGSGMALPTPPRAGGWALAAPLPLLCPTEQPLDDPNDPGAVSCWVGGAGTAPGGGPQSPGGSQQAQSGRAQTPPAQHWDFS